MQWRAKRQRAENAATSILSKVGATASGPIFSLAIGGAALIVGIALVTLVAIANFRQRALDHATRQLESSALLFVRHFKDHLEDFALAQRQFAAEVRSGDDDFDEARLSTRQTHERLKAMIGSGEDVAGINVWNAEGRFINSSSAWPVPDRDIGQRDYLKVLKSDPSAAVQVELVRSTLTGNWAIILAQRIVSARGEFLGVATRGFSPKSMEDFFASTEPGPHASIALVHMDGTLMARYPHVDDAVGRKVAVDRSRMQEALQRHTLRQVGPVDGVKRIISIRQIDGFPLVLSVSMSEEAALAEWRQQTRFLAGVGLLASLIIAVTLTLITRQLSRQHKAAQRQLRREKERLATAVNNMSQALLLFDASGRIVMCNERYMQMFDTSPEVIKPGCSLRALMQHRQETGTLHGDIETMLNNFFVQLAKGPFASTHSDPRGRTAEFRYLPLSEGGWLTTIEDISDRLRYEERITRLAHYDSLTDLPNRALFRERLQSALDALQPGEKLALLYIDIDEFKSINDTLGHPIGDELLKTIATALRRCCSDTDFVGRLGGDEFALFRTGVQEEEQLVALINAIFAAVRAPADCLGHTVATDASIGIAVAAAGMVDLDHLVKNADLALYEAKAGGRHDYRFFEPAMHQRVMAKRSMEVELRKAIEEKQLELHYQPVLEARNERIVGCEALLRWRHPERGMISPAEFIPLAEQSGLIDQIGEWVLTSACAEAVKWPDSIRIAVNVSPVQFRNPAFAMRVIAALASSGLSPERLELEVTETVLIEDDDATLLLLNELRKLGVRIALDDFGTGYSSLSHLKRFPFDKIKIDRSFVSNVTEAADSAAIVRAVVDIAETKRIATTAEGVETKQQLALLVALGCTEMQGFLFSPALAAADLAALLQHQANKAAAA